MPGYQQEDDEEPIPHSIDWRVYGWADGIKIILQDRCEVDIPLDPSEGPGCPQDYFQMPLWPFIVFGDAQTTV